MRNHRENIGALIYILSRILLLADGAIRDHRAWQHIHRRTRRAKA